MTEAAPTQPKPLIWTMHALDRARQRAIPLAVAELVYAEGEPLTHRPDRFLLSREGVRALRGSGYDETLLARAEAAAPVVAVVVNSWTVITVYRPRRGRKSLRGFYRRPHSEEGAA